MGAVTETNYNPGGVLPEVSGTSWILFGQILAGLLLLLFVPILVGRGVRLFSGAKQKGRVKMSHETAGAAGGRSPGGSAKKPRIKIK
jgi:hypothetical protein